MTNEKNIHQRINEAKHSMEGFIKDSKGYQYNYVSGSQVLHKLNPELYKHGINITFKTSDAKYEAVNVVVKGKEKTEYIVSLNVHYTITNTDRIEEKIESTIFAIGQQDDPSKALGTALTYSERYFLMKFFGLPTDEDDADARQKREVYAAKARPEHIKDLKEKIAQAVEIGGDDASEQKVMQWLRISDYDAVTEAQINPMIKQLNGLIDNKKKQANNK